MKRQVTLEYTLESGWLTSWLDGLRAGKAVASACSACDDAHFPPLRACPTCRLPTDGWRTLSGGASILFRTNGTDGDIAMVQFDGARGAAIADARGLAKSATRTMLGPCPNDPPTLTLIAEPET